MSTERNRLFADALNEMGAAAGFDDGVIWLVDDQTEPFMIVSPRFQILHNNNGPEVAPCDATSGGFAVSGWDTTDDRAVSATYDASGPSGLLTWKAVEDGEETPVTPAEPTSEPTKQYLGDGAYVNFDGNGLILTAENGIYATDTVYLEPQVWDRLKRYVADLKGRI